MARQDPHPCRHCGDHATCPDLDGSWCCAGCYLELTEGTIPPLEQITSPRPTRIPRGCSIRRLGRTPGTGEGNDWFGNHT